MAQKLPNVWNCPKYGKHPWIPLFGDSKRASPENRIYLQHIPSQSKGTGSEHENGPPQGSQPENSIRDRLEQDLEDLADLCRYLTFKHQFIILGVYIVGWYSSRNSFTSYSLLLIIYNELIF